jgi:hypothetical protein
MDHDPRSHRSRDADGQLGNRISDLTSRANIGVEDARVRLAELNEQLVARVRARPGAALLIAAAAGFLIGRLLRA